ncbi:hypothetical protein [Bradyrhizobium sp. WSM2254]|uniref:hypothetical protein n=1 Tax=Bradyrhizobium sp. WSM2254 TaxID=1188263 RepID=UPI0012EBF371|nr:hypothetical protein [Bradyrhizobium sp. WSM2254]
MMGRQRAGQAQFSYSFHLEERVPASDLLRKIEVFVSQALADVHREMAAFYSHIGRPSIDPEYGLFKPASSTRVNPVSHLLT